MENILQRFSCISLFKPPWLDRVVEDSVNRVLDYIQGGPNKSFVCEELMHIPEDTQVPPEGVSNVSNR